MAGRFNIINRIKIHTPYPNLDVYYGPYDSIELALLSVPLVIREKGLTIGILINDKVVEYWWDSGVEDQDLKPKLSDISIGLSGETQARINADAQIINMYNDGAEVVNYEFNVLNNKVNQIIKDLTGETYNSKNTFNSDFTVQLMSGLSFGKYNSGDIVPANGKTAMEVILDAAIQYMAPSFSSAYLQYPTTYEVGEEILSTKNIVFSISNQQNVRENTLSLFDITNNTTMLDSQPVVPPLVLNSIGIKYATPSWRSWRISFVNTNNQLVNSNPMFIYWKYHTFHGSFTGDTIDSQSVRSLSNLLWDDINSFQINIDLPKYLICIPNNKNLISIITTNNENITDNFDLISSNEPIYMKDNITIKEYKVYKLDTAQALDLYATVILS